MCDYFVDQQLVDCPAAFRGKCKWKKPRGVENEGA